MSDMRWKQMERRMAKALGTQRIPVTGERDGADFADGIAVYQLKSRKCIPGWLSGWLRGIRSTGQRQRKAGVLVLHRPGQDRRDALVVLSFEDWCALHGRAGGIDQEGAL